MSEFITAQEEEIEVLLSIFPTELELLTNDKWKYKISLYPDNSIESSHVAIELFVNYPKTYPDICPIFEIKPVKGLIESQIDELILIAKRVANDNIGTASVFMICDGLREYLYENNTYQDDSMFADMQRRMLQSTNQKKKENDVMIAQKLADNELNSEIAVDPIEEEKLRRRQQGTPVTVESFMKWKRAFESEKLLFEGEVNKDDNDRPTGKQLFMTNKAGHEEALLTSIEEEEIVEQDDDDDDDSDYIDDDNDYSDDDTDIADKIAT